MYTLFVVLIVLVALLMIFIVLIQESKGGGLASNFSSSNAIMGVRKTTDVVEKLTWGLAAAMVIISVACAYVAPTAVGESSVMEILLQLSRLLSLLCLVLTMLLVLRLQLLLRVLMPRRLPLLLMLRRLPLQFLQLLLSNFSILLREI